MTTYVMCPQFGAGAQFFDQSGVPLAGGLLYTYIAGTTTPASTWTSHLADTLNSNPIEFDAAGRIVEEVWIDLSLQYKFVLCYADDTQIWSHDYISFYTAPNLTLPLLANAVDPAKGDALIGYQQSNPAGVLAGAVSKTVHDKLQEFVSVKDFGAVGDGVTDDTDAILLAVKANRHVTFPPGDYIITDTLEFDSIDNVTLYGESSGTAAIKAKVGVVFTNPMLLVTNGHQWTIDGLTFDWNSNTSFTTAAGQGVLWLREMIQLTFTNNYVLHDNRGLFLRFAQYALIEGNIFQKATAVSTENYNLHISDEASDPGSLSEFVTVSNNVLISSGSFFAGRSFVINGNICSYSKFGAGINTWSSNTKSYIGHVITNNICRDNTGADAAGPVRGMEILGQYHQVSGNQCHGNGGPGIAWFAFKSICSDNICWNNGTEATATPAQRSGILAIAGVDVLAQPQESLITGNRCFTAGSSQDYGYAEEGSFNLAHIVNNDFSGNLVAGTLLNPSNTSNIYDIDEWVSFTPTIDTSIGAITTLGTVSCTYMRRGGLVFYNLDFVITTNGTGAGQIRATLPIASNSFSNSSHMSGHISGAAGAMLQGYVPNASPQMYITLYDGTYPGADGTIITISGFYAR